MACGCTAQLNGQVTAGDAFGGYGQTVEWRDDGAPHPIGYDAHQQRQSRGKQEEELEQFEPRLIDLGAVSLRHDDYRQRTRHIGNPENFALMMSFESHRFTWLGAQVAQWLWTERHQRRRRGLCAEQRLAVRCQQDQ